MMKVLRSCSRWRWFTLAMLLWAATLTAHAKRVALVIGNDSYQSVARLQNARTDARAMAESLLPQRRP